jgi:hypothetical protein
MASITLFALVALLVGFFGAFKIARRSRGNGALKFVGSAFSASLLGIALTFGAGLSHGLCAGVLKYCAPTTDTNVFNVSFPLMAVPLYWMLMLFTPRAQMTEGER